MDIYKEIIKKHKDGVTINLFVTTDSKKIKFPVGFNEWRKCIDINVCAPAQENKANREVLQTVAGFFDKPFSNVLLVSGKKNKEKTVLIKNSNVNEIGKKIEASLNGL
jgi:uncharacterized protein (TIGR00251 family)